MKTARQLDELQCCMPGCDHKSHSKVLYFHGRCHIQIPSIIVYNKPTLNVRCAECNKEIVSVNILLDDADPVFLKDKAQVVWRCGICNSKKLWASYELASARLAVSCAKCKNEIYKVPIC